MKPLYTASQSKQLDQLSERFGVSTATLMQQAGRGIAALLEELCRKEDRLVFLIGKGNNGGDGRVAADILKQRGYDVVTVSPGEKPVRGDWVIDALFGIGLDRPVEGWYAEVIEAVNACGGKVLAIDIPSGLSSDTGKPLGMAMRATITASLGGLKLGEWVTPGADYCGTIREIDIGISPKAYETLLSGVTTFLLEKWDFKNLLPPRKKDSHKKNFGHVLVIAGSVEMPGAGFLASLAALRAGAGMVTACLPASAYEKFDADFPEVMVKPFTDIGELLRFAEDKESVVLGPGMGQSAATESLIVALVQQLKQAIVLDADGINALSRHPELAGKLKAPVVFTPHPGEMSRLLLRPTKEIQENRIASAKEAAAIWKQDFVLKGYHSLIATGDGNLYVSPTGNPGMATAGAGDVLAGMIAGLIAQGASPKEAALAGTFLHGLAGDLAAAAIGEKGLISSDIVGYIPRALHEVSL